MRRFDIDERDDDGPEPGAAMREAVSPEPDDTPQAKAAAMRRAAKAALKANPEIEASVTRQPEPLPEPEPTGDAPESESVSQGSDNKRLPWRGNGEGPSFNATVNVPTEPTNAAELERFS